MKAFADYHTHTLYSDGHGTVLENVEAARKIGLREVGISDHGPNSTPWLGVKSLKRFSEIRTQTAELNRHFPDIRVLVGCEANLIGLDGTLDVPNRIQKQLDYVQLGFHPNVWPASLRDGLEICGGHYLGFISRAVRRRVRVNHTKALIEAVHRNAIRVITHPGLKVSIDTAELARACAKTSTCLEINTGHGPISEEYIRVAYHEGAHFAIGSDAHEPGRVGQLEAGVRAAERVGVLPESIVNVE